MFNKIIVVAFFTGLGHLINLFILKFLSSNFSKYSVAKIGEIDSFILLLVSLLAFGLQLSATRKLAILDDWKQEYYATQSARLMLSILLMIFAVTGFYVFQNILFLAAPVFALNGDYALYGRGLPKMGAFVSFLRVAFPALSLLLSAIYFPDYLIESYAISLILSYLIAGKIVSATLKVKYYVRPRFKSLKKFVNHLDIGFASVAYIFLGLGLINVVSYFNDDETIAIAYLALKFYMIFKGVRMIIVQTFFQELIEETVALKVDCIAMIAGVIFLNTLLFYPDAIIPLLFDQKYVAFNLTFAVLGLSGFVSSFTTSTGTRLLLKNKDKTYSMNLIIAASVTILFGILFSHYFGTSFYICLAVLLGETTLSLLNIRSLNEKLFIPDRIKFLTPLLIITGLFFISAYLFGQRLQTFTISLILCCIVALLFIKIKFKEGL